jgi:chromosome segregation ATPase
VGSPTPSSSQAAREARLSEINSELASLDPANANTSNATADLDARIAADQQAIDSMKIDAFAEQSTIADELGAIRSRQEQESVVQQEQLSVLTQQIKEQEQVLAVKQQVLMTSIAPEDGELRPAVESDYKQAVQTLAALRAEFANVRADQAASPDRQYSEQTGRIDSIRSRQSGLAGMILSAQSDIAAANSEKSRLLSERSTKAKHAQALQAERDQLQSAPQRTAR